MKALLVGGTGPTGPHIAAGLIERGYEVTVLHRGAHEIDSLSHLEHIHADPHFTESFEEALMGRQFDISISTYGRIRLQVETLANRSEHFFGVGGVRIYPGNSDPEQAHPYGTRISLSEEEVAVAATRTGSASSKFVARMLETERRVFDLHRRGRYRATWFRYPVIYGPRNPVPWEWSVIRRVQDHRPYIIVPDGGHHLHSRASVRNAAHAILLAVDQPHASAGQVYNVADDDQYTVRQWVELVASYVPGELPILSLPHHIADPGYVLLPARGTGSPHVLVDTTKIRSELGYSDIRPATLSIEESVEWYKEHPVSSQTYPNFSDTFDYVREDRLAEMYCRSLANIQRSIEWPTREVIHNYAHPREINQTLDHRRR